MSYDLSLDYLKFVVRWTYDSDLERAKISVENTVSCNLRTLFQTFLRFCERIMGGYLRKALLPS